MDSVQTTKKTVKLVGNQRNEVKGIIFFVKSILFDLLNLFKQLKNSDGAIEKCANEFG